MEQNKRYRVACILGTRPEIIKMAPIIFALRDTPWAEVWVINSSQHRSLADDMFETFNISPDIDLNCMKPNQTLDSLTSELCVRFNQEISQHQFDLFLAVGDTTTVFVSALIAFYHHIPFGHIEAGLRTYNNFEPFPEEMNRALTSKLSTLHFAPTKGDKQNLINEQINPASVFITGNPVIDALFWVLKTYGKDPAFQQWSNIVVITAHRRESFGPNLENICKAVKSLSSKYPSHDFVWPVHPNPKVKDTVYSMLKGIKNIHLIEPLTYKLFLQLMNKAKLIMTDSGGIQEEAPALCKPVVILRETTERPLVIEQKLAMLAGTKTKKIIDMVSHLLDTNGLSDALSQGISPYGDGKSAQRIIKHIHNYLTASS